MNSEQLAAEVEDTIRFCQKGILTVGKDQYLTEVDGRPMQKFEIMKLDDFIEYAQEEARDLVNYGVMLNIRLQRLRGVLAEMGMVAKVTDPDIDPPLREKAEYAVAEAYSEEGQRVWWKHHDAQTPEEQQRLQRLVVQANAGYFE